MSTPLPPHPTINSRPGPVVLCIMDGVGIGPGGAGDAVALAATPNLDRWLRDAPNTALTASGTSVGLPTDGDMGNSEVGHNAMGAGRVVDQGAKLVENALADGEIWRTQTWRALVDVHTLHLIGLCSDGNVHSHLRHLLALIDRAAIEGVRSVKVHVLTDGRDVPARSAEGYIAELERTLGAHRDRGLDYRVASGGGRMQITMDRYEAD
ncbi:MAG: 2,3-bisphosphoglycerate-independent phosphoglycerate mutase, partial [Kiritimatiellia bacterium]